MLRCYRVLLRLLPRDFRREYGEEMCRVVGEHWQRTRGQRSFTGAARFWTRQAFAVVRAAFDAQPARHPLPRRQAPDPRPGAARLGRLPSERYAHQDRSSAMDNWLQDVRYSLRGMRARPALALITITTLALGIGASTSIFSAVHAVLFRELPYGDADDIVAVFHEDLTTGERGGGLSAINARDLAEAAEHLSAVAVADPYSLDLQVDGRAESLRTWSVTEGFFDAVRAQPLLGRTFSPEEHLEGGAAVAVLGYSTWRNRFGGDSEIVGEAVTLDGTPVTIVGVMPAAFKLPDQKELWIPRPIQAWDQNARAADYMFGVGRLAPGSSLLEAQAEAARIAVGLAEAYPRWMGGTTFRLVPLREYLFGDVRTPLLVLMGAVGFVLLIACANVAGLMLARGTERHREFALRSAIGASKARLMRQITIDSLLLAMPGCLLGIGITFLGVQVIRGLGSGNLPRIEEVAVDQTVLLFAVVIAGISAFLAGLAPSLRFSHPDLRDTLNEGTRGSTGGPEGRTLRSAIVVAEIALAMVLLVGAGLLARSFDVLTGRSLGFDPSNRLAVQVFAYGYGQDGTMTRGEFVNQSIEAMEAIPGVRRVALTSTVPGATDGTLASIDIDLPFTIVDRVPPPEGSEPEANIALISDGYLDVLAIPLVAGRNFDATDNTDALPVVLINETFARRHFPDGDAIGSNINIAPGNDPVAHEIIGVVADTLPAGHESVPRPDAFFSFRQYGGLGMAGNLTFVLHSETDAAQITNPAKEAIWRVNPVQSVWGAVTLDSLLGEWLQQRRFNLLLLGSFALTALALAAIGIYGLISFSVQQRVGEMGIRRALGGGSGTIVGMVLREAQILAAIGLAIGIAGALTLARFIRGMLFGVEATDPATFVGLAATVLAVAAIAALLPALRAMRIDPVVALRGD